jgi:hypothetical protein
MKKLIYYGLCFLAACSSPDVSIQEISREGNEIKKSGKEIYFNKNDTTVLKYHPGLSYFNSFDSNTNAMIIINDRKNNEHYTIYIGNNGINGINHSLKNENTFYVNEKNIDFLKNIFNENRIEISKDSIKNIYEKINIDYPLEYRLN